jgi:hypothetical protein
MTRTLWLVLFGAIVLAAAGAAVVWRNQSGSSTGNGEDQPTGPDTVIRFEDVTKTAGITFNHFDSLTPMRYIQETMGSGLAWIDYDNDGWLDLFCVQDGPVKPDPSAKDLPTCRLYRNNGDGTFTDVTERVGLARAGYGMGVAVGDYDNDGFDDLFVTFFDGVALYHNEPADGGGRRFVDVTAKAGIVNPHWGTSCGWGDIDGDGLLDLYVCNYVEIDLNHYTPCVHAKLQERYACPPRVFPTTKHALYHNNGNGTFTDVTVSSGVGEAKPSPGLGVVLLDLDGDGKLDIYVANDMMPAYLFHNQGDGKFVEKGVLSGCGLQANGRYLAGMGIAVGDVDGSGRPSLFVTNYQNEPNNLFLNRGKLQFTDGTYTSGLGPPSVPFLAFGAVMLDADRDGLLDIVVANGHVLHNSEPIDGGSFAQTPQFFRGIGNARFQEVSGRVGPYFRQKRVARGLAMADFDNDGLPDLAFSNNGGPLGLLRNTTTKAGHWLRLELVGDGKKSNRNAIGSVVEVEYAGGRQTHWIIGGGSYLSASDRRLLLGLGEATRAERVRVTWPSGQQQVFANLSGDAGWRLREGQGQAERLESRPVPR